MAEYVSDKKIEIKFKYLLELIVSFDFKWTNCFFFKIDWVLIIQTPFGS